MALRAMILDLSAGQLSDLFFNYEHPEYTKLWSGDDFEQDDEKEALLKDAKDFVHCHIGQDKYNLANELVEDFFSRR